MSRIKPDHIHFLLANRPNLASLSLANLASGSQS